MKNCAAAQSPTNNPFQTFSHNSLKATPMHDTPPWTLLTHDALDWCAQLMADHIEQLLLCIHQPLQLVNDQDAVALLHVWREIEGNNYHGDGDGLATASAACLRPRCGCSPHRWRTENGRNTAAPGIHQPLQLASVKMVCASDHIQVPLFKHRPVRDRWPALQHANGQDAPMR
eukprot:1158185-Pelagomonas_calceolata.AAC.6